MTSHTGRRTAVDGRSTILLRVRLVPPVYRFLQLSSQSLGLNHYESVLIIVGLQSSANSTTMYRLKLEWERARGSLSLDR